MANQSGARYGCPVLLTNFRATNPPYSQEVAVTRAQKKSPARGAQRMISERDGLGASDIALAVAFLLADGGLEAASLGRLNRRIAG
jgi:hypothetical protein